MRFFASRILAGVIRLAAPRWSLAPQRDGYQRSVCPRRTVGPTTNAPVSNVTTAITENKLPCFLTIMAYLPRNQFTRSVQLDQQAHQCQKTQNSQRCAGDLPSPFSEGTHFFGENKQGNCGNPQEIHDSTHEKQQHEKSTTSQTIDAVIDTHPKRPQRAVSPVFTEEVRRRAAVPKTELLEWCPLVHTCSE